MKHHHHYRVNISWDAEDECYIARVPALPGCLAHGDTIEEAAHEIQDAIEGVIETKEAHGDPIPESDLAADEIRRYAPILNVSALGRISGINKHTLATKLRRGTKFSEEEARRIREALTV